MDLTDTYRYTTPSPKCPTTYCTSHNTMYWAISTDDEMHFQVEEPDPIACEECAVQYEFGRFVKREIPIHGKPVTLGGSSPV